MRNLLLLFLLISMYSIGYAQYCTTGGPNLTADSNVESVNISGDAGSNISHLGCPGVAGVRDNTTDTVRVTANSSYTLDVQFGTCGGNYAGAGEAWIDWNHNDVFDPAESLGTWAGTPPVAVSSFVFTVPTTAFNGATRMRVMQREGGVNPLDPCGTYNWGSVDDFTVIISGGVTQTCPAPNSLTANAITATSADLGWTENGTATQWQIQYGPSGFALGTGADTVVSANPSTIAGLTSSTSYDFYVRAICGAGDTSIYAGPFTFITNCVTFSLPWSEGFDNGGAIPLCWTMGGGEPWLFNTTGPNHVGFQGTLSGITTSGGYYAVVDASGSSAPATLTSPLVDISTLANPMLSFYEISDNEGFANSQLDVEVWDGAAWNLMATYNTNTNGWQKKEIYLSSLTFTGPAQVRFTFSEVINPSDFYDDIAIDDVTFEEAPSCPAVTNLVVNSVLPDSANIGWTENGSATNWEIQWGPSPLTLGSGTIIPVGTNPASLTGLIPNAAHDIYIRSICGAGDTSSWSGPLTFITPCAAFIAPWTDDVEGLNTAQGFTNNNCWNASAQSVYDWNVDDNGSTPSSNTGPLSARSGVKYFYTEASGGAIGDTATLISPSVDISALTSPSLEFFYHMHGNQMGQLIIEVYDGANWNVEGVITGEIQPDQSTDWIRRSINLSAYAGVVQVRFLAVSNGTFEGDISLDDISIVESHNPLSLRITEIMYNGPEAGTDSTEFIEFYNNDSLIADLANYYFTQGVTHTFTEGIILPGEYFTIAVNQSGFFNSFGVQANAIWTSGGLSNGGEDITLKDVFNNTVDSVNYDDIAPWPTDGDGFGPSIVLCDPNRDGNDGANWARSYSFTGDTVNGYALAASPGAQDAFCSIVQDVAPVQLIGGGQLYCNVDSVSGQVVISNLSPLDANDVIYDIQAAGGLFQIAYDTISLLAGSASDTINIGPLPTLGFNGVLPITTIVSYLLDGNQANDTLTGFVILSNIDIITNAVDAACFGDNSFITATVVGGYGPTNLAWNDGSINDTIVGAAGAYFVTAVDSVGCLVTVNDTINEPAQLIASAVDNGNGTASASSTGGTAPVTFLWSNGDTSATATAATSGVYTVTITDANGCTDTANVNITITGQIELLASGQLTVYPNPTRADLTLDFNLANQSDVTVRIFNANGQLVNERILSDMQSDNFVMDVQEYPSGLYMLNVLIDNQSYSLRFVKE